MARVSTYAGYQTNTVELANSRLILSKDLYCMVQLIKPGSLRPSFYELTLGAAAASDLILPVTGVTKDGVAITEPVNFYTGDHIYITGQTDSIVIGAKSTIAADGTGNLNVFPLPEAVTAGDTLRSYAMIRVEGYKGGLFGTTANIAEQIPNDGRSYSNKAPTTRDGSYTMELAGMNGDDGANLLFRYGQGLNEFLVMIALNPFQPFKNSKTYGVSQFSRYARCYFAGDTPETSTPEYGNISLEMAVSGQPKQPLPIDFDVSLLDPDLAAQIALGTEDHFWNPPGLSV